jgi:hypothetical protein
LLPSECSFPTPQNGNLLNIGRTAPEFVNLLGQCMNSHNGYTAALNGMIEALGLEVEAIKNRGGSRSIQIRGGQFRARMGSRFAYAFPLAEEVHLRDDSPIQIIIGKEKVDGEVASVADGILLITLERDLGPTIPSARLVADDSFLVERLKEKLEAVRAGQTFFERELAAKALGEVISQTGSVPVDRSLAGGNQSCNEEQELAISKALGSEVTFVWGPPGTGKTTVIARIVEGYYRKGLSVLVVSNTNIAVDTALEKICERLKHDEGFLTGGVVRYGPIVKDELKKRFEDKVSIDRIVERLGRNLTLEKTDLEEAMNEEKDRETSLRKSMEEIQQLEDERKRLDWLEDTARQHKDKIKQARVELAELEVSKRSLKDQLQRANTMGGVRRLFAGLNPDRLSRELGGIELSLTAKSDLISGLEPEVQQLAEKIRNSRQKTELLTARMRNYPSSYECRAMLKAAEERIAELWSKIQAIQKQLDALRDQVVRNCRVLAATVYRTYLKGQVERTFDAVVVDEASMLALPMTFYASGLAKHHVVVAGDFRQIPAIVLSKELLAETWLKRDIFHKFGIPDALDDGKEIKELIELKKQYRMNEEICAVVNEIFYGGKLKTMAKGKPDDPFPLGDRPLLYIDTSQFNPWAALQLGTYSRYNLVHALLARNIACHLAERKYLEDQIDQFGILTPYTAQNRLIQSLISEALDCRGAQLAATVHRFQGNERDAILIDLTDSFGCRPSKFITARNIDEDGARLLNVALSRAKHTIVLLANFEYLRKRLSRSSIVRKILETFQQKGQALEAEELFKLGPEDWSSVLRGPRGSSMNLDSTSTGLFDEGTFYDAFGEDIKAAQESIVIFSPFVTPSGTSRWVDVLRAKREQGVRVRIVTKPPNEMGNMGEECEEVVKELDKLGFVVDVRARLHEKFAVIDETVVWHGSLNILSHRDTSESMFRLPSAVLCTQLIRLNSPPSAFKGEANPDFAERQNPPCSKCSGLTALLKGKYGIFFKCISCGGTTDSRPRRSTRRSRVRSEASRTKKRKRSSTYSRTGKDCPECGRQLARRDGPHGPFYGCSGYPLCRHTESVR